METDYKTARCRPTPLTLSIPNLLRLTTRREDHDHTRLLRSIFPRRLGGALRSDSRRPGGNLSGRAEIVQGDQVRSTINSSGVYKTRLELAEALKKDAFRWITGQERDRRA